MKIIIQGSININLYFPTFKTNTKMNTDLALKKEEMKMIVLICGNPQTGKKLLVSSWIKEKNGVIEKKVFYEVFTFDFKETIDNIPITLSCEIRILNSENTIY